MKYVKKKGWDRYSPVIDWNEMLKFLEKEGLKEVVDMFDQRPMNIGEVIGLLGEELDDLKIDDYLKIICDVAISWKNYQDIVFESLRLLELIFKRPYSLKTAEEASEFLQILGSEPNCLVMVLDFDYDRIISCRLKIADQFFHKYKRIYPDIEQSTKYAHNQVCQYLEKEGVKVIDL